MLPANYCLSDLALVQAKLEPKWQGKKINRGTYLKESIVQWFLFPQVPKVIVLSSRWGPRAKRLQNQMLSKNPNVHLLLELVRANLCEHISQKPVLQHALLFLVFFNKRPNNIRTVHGGKHRQLKRLADERKLT